MVLRVASSAHVPSLRSAPERQLGPAASSIGRACAIIIGSQFLVTAASAQPPSGAAASAQTPRAAARSENVTGARAKATILRSVVVRQATGPERSAAQPIASQINRRGGTVWIELE